MLIAAIGVKLSSPGPIYLGIFFVVMVAAMSLTTGRTTMLLTGLALIFAIGPKPLSNLRQNLNWCTIGFLAFALCNGIFAVFSEFGGSALGELYKFLASSSVAIIVLLWFRAKHANSLLWGLAAISAGVGILGVDAAAGGLFFTIFNAIAAILGMDFSYVDRIMDGRVNGIYNNANVTGGLLAVGTLLSLYLLSKAETKRQYRLAALLLGLNAMGFFLSMSRGAILCFALALLVWLVAAGKGQRIRLFMLIFFSAAATVALSIPATVLIRYENVLATLCMFVCGVVIWLLERLLVEPVSNVLEKHIRIAAVVAGILILACVGYMAAAVSVSGPSTVLPNDIYRRAVDLKPGGYTVTGDWDGEPSVIVQVRPQQYVEMQKWNTAYKGALKDAAFEVPEDTAQIQVEIRVQEAVEIREIAFSDGTQLHLGYPLLPSFVADRIQDGVFTSANFLQRFQFMKDGLKIFASSPITGHGLGSTENLYTSVQPYYYETLFVHNHLIQVMCDMGVIGLAAFLLFLLGGLIPLLKRLKEDRDPLAAVLLACWVMVNAHSLMEINFSVRGYQILIFPVLLLPGLLYAKPVSAKAVKTGGTVAMGLTMAYLAVFGGLVMSSRSVSKSMARFEPVSVEAAMAAFQSGAKWDVFKSEQYKLNYIVNAVDLEEERFMPQARKYLDQLSKDPSYTVNTGLMRYVYLPAGDLDDLFAASRRGLAQLASNKDAWNAQFRFYREEALPLMNEENITQFMEGVLATETYLTEYSRDRWEEIQLDEENRRFLGLVHSVYDQGITGADALLLLNI